MNMLSKLLISQLLDALNYQAQVLIDVYTYDMVQCVYDLILRSYE